MVLTIIWLIICIAWLLYETRYMRVRLVVGTVHIENDTLENYGWFLQSCNTEYHKVSSNLFGSGRMYAVFHKGDKYPKVCAHCNDMIERDSIKAQQPTKPRDAYPATHYPSNVSQFPLTGWTAPDMRDYEPTIEIYSNGKLLRSINGWYKQGMIKELMRA